MNPCMFTNSPVSSNSVTPKFLVEAGSLFEWYPMTTHLSPCFWNKVPLTPSQEVPLS